VESCEDIDPRDLDYFARVEEGYRSLCSGAYTLPGYRPPVHHGLNWDMRVPGDYRKFCENTPVEQRVPVSQKAFASDLVALHDEMRQAFESK
jgi:hypothetical protein